MQPHLVDHVQGEKPPAPRTRRILSAGVDHTLLQMLKGVVSDAGTAVGAEIPGYSVAGKTGTAQKPGPNGYEPGKYVASFVGMVPASNPSLVVLVQRRRAARRDLRRHRRGAGVRADRGLRPAVPRSAAGPEGAVMNAAARGSTATRRLYADVYQLRPRDRHAADRRKPRAGAAHLRLRRDREQRKPPLRLGRLAGR